MVVRAKGSCCEVEIAARAQVVVSSNLTRSLKIDQWGFDLKLKHDDQELRLTDGNFGEWWQSKVEDKFTAEDNG